jgi:hypothetical protein
MRKLNQTVSKQESLNQMVQTNKLGRITMALIATR